MKRATHLKPLLFAPPLKKLVNGWPILWTLLVLIGSLNGCTRKDRAEPIDPQDPSPRTPAGATEGNPAEEPKTPRSDPQGTGRAVLVISRQKIMASSLTQDLKDEIFQSPERFRLELSTDPPLLNTQTPFPSLTQDESLWTLRVPAHSGLVALSVKLVQTATNIPVLTSSIKLEAQNFIPEYKWTMEWLKAQSPPGSPPGKNPKISALQKWDGLKDENGRTFKIAPATP